MKLLIKVTHIFDGTVSLLAYLAGVLIIFIMLSVSLEVLMRYFLARPQVWVVEVTEICLLYICFLGTTWLLRREGHVKMDMVLNYLKPGAQAVVNIVTSVIGAIVFLAITWYGAQVTWHYYQAGHYTVTWLEVPDAIILCIIPIGSFLLFIQFLRRGYGYLGKRRGVIEPETKGIEEPRSD